MLKTWWQTWRDEEKELLQEGDAGVQGYLGEGMEMRIREGMWGEKSTTPSAEVKRGKEKMNGLSFKELWRQMLSSRSGWKRLRPSSFSKQPLAQA